MSDPETTQTPEDMVRASIFLEYYGSSSHDPEQWHKWRYAETGYAPEWLSKDDLTDDSQLDFTDHDECVTVLDFSLSEPDPPEGWRVAYQYPAGEKDCPWCRPDNEPAEDEHQLKRSECKLCEGDGLLYWGEECVVVVFAPLPTPEKWHAELVELLERRDNTGALTADESRRFFRVFEALNDLAIEGKLPEEWKP
jgi:hypothetical protein